MRFLTPAETIKTHFQVQLLLLKSFFRHLPRTVILATACLMASQFAQVFSLFFPLKIILILGSGTTPAFLRNVITPETYGAWVTGLTIATLILYIAVMVFDLIANRLMRRGGAQMTKLLAPGKTIPDEQREQMKRLFITACRSYANATVVLIGGVGLLIIYPIIFLALILIMMTEIVILNSLISVHGGWLGRVSSAITRSPELYIKYLAAINFICVFMLLLAGYYFTGKIEPTAAILALLLSRRMFRSMSRYGEQAINLQQLHDAIANEGRVKFT